MCVEEKCADRAWKEAEALCNGSSCFVAPSNGRARAAAREGREQFGSWD